MRFTAMKFKKRNLQYGFTLLEILVVMIIIAIASSIIVLKMGDFYLSNKRIEVFAKELSSLIQLARNQAIFSMNVIGLRITGRDVTFVQLDDTKDMNWKTMDKKDAFWTSRTIPENVVIEVKMEGGGNDQSLQKKAFSPQIIIFPSGEMTPFTLSMHRLGSAQTYTIKGSYIGQIELYQTE